MTQALSSESEIQLSDSSTALWTRRGMCRFYSWDWTSESVILTFIYLSTAAFATISLRIMSMTSGPFKIATAILAPRSAILALT